MTSKHFWKGFINGAYAVRTTSEKEYRFFTEMCKRKGLEWIQGQAPSYEHCSNFLNLCIIYDEIGTLLCVDYCYCINKGYEVLDSAPFLKEFRN